MAKKGDNPKKNTSTFLIKITVAIIVILGIYVYLIRDNEKLEKQYEQRVEEAILQKSSFKDIIKEWYSSSINADKTPTVLDSNEHKYNIVMVNNKMEVQDKESNLVIGKLDSNFELPLQNLQSALVDDKLFFFDLTLEKEFECKEDDTECISELSKFADIAGIWKFDLEKKEFERIIIFELRDN